VNHFSARLEAVPDGRQAHVRNPNPETEWPDHYTTEYNTQIGIDGPDCILSAEGRLMPQGPGAAPTHAISSRRRGEARSQGLSLCAEGPSMRRS